MADRVDLHCSYTRLPDLPSPAFPDRKEALLPLLEVAIVGLTGKGFTTTALLDTGSAITVFGTPWAEALGIDWRNAPQMPFQGIGSVNVGYAADIRVVIPQANYGWPVRAIFSPAADRLSHPLLGHRGFFGHFEVRFKASQRTFRVNLK